MKVLLTDASSLSSRQLSTILSRAGHAVHLLSPAFSPLTGLTSHVTKRHHVPPFGVDPYKWLEAALSVIISAKKKGLPFDVLICSQEQVTVISAEIDQVRATGIHVAVPEFKSLKKVMDKVSAAATLSEMGLHQPRNIILTDLASSAFIPADMFPAYAKVPIATGSTGVRRVPSVSDLEDLDREWRPFERRASLLLQKEVNGPLLMICGVFSHGNLVTWHACHRAREGINGGASKKVSCPLPALEIELRKLGRELSWHGALSADVILVGKEEGEEGEKECLFIDINPRIVEPMNGLLAGVDLVAALIDVSLDDEGSTRGAAWKSRPGKEGVQTHQLILALMAAAKKGRVDLMKELWMAIRGLDGFYGYKGSSEELTPIKGDCWSIVVLLGISFLLLFGGSWMADKLSQGTIKNYAVSREGWQEICWRQEEKEAARNETQTGQQSGEPVG